MTGLVALIFFVLGFGSLTGCAFRRSQLRRGKRPVRLGRNYIETGKVLQEFADHGVRFIAINDGYDTANAQGQASTILLPIKNLMKNISCLGRVFC